MRFLFNKPSESARLKCRRLSSRGFTLVEIVIAVALVGITFGAIFQALSLGMKSIRRTDVFNTALQLCQNKMNELLIDDEVFTDDVREGQWNDDFWWRAQLEVHEIDDLTIDKSRLSTRLLYIRLTVFYNFSGQIRTVKLFTIKLVPKPKIGERGYLGR